jgi:hypothetical protein
MKFTLPISPEYVSHWGLWEAVREIYQNALDEASADKECQARIEYLDYSSQIQITTSKGRLSPDSLVLGKTSKRDDQTQRGKFGEGYKLALLVLARSADHFVTVYSGPDRWRVAIEHDDTFNSPVLNIYVEGYETMEGTMFAIDNVTPEQWETIQSNIRPQSEFFDTILEDEKEKGRIYVGGLYVSTAKRFQCGYAFRPGVVKLDRDRGMVDGFDLAWQTSKLWTSRGHSIRVSELLEAEAPDVEYVENHVSEGSTFAASHYSHYTLRYGYDSVPVSNQEEIQRAAAAGIKWVLVPEKVKSMLRLVKSWFIPTTEPPVERLKKFREKHAYYLTNDGKHELDEIIQSMEPEKSSVLAEKA